MARALSCYRCAQENPASFPACARCYAPLSTSPLTQVDGGRISSDDFGALASQELALDDALAAAERGVLGRDAEIAKIREALASAYRERQPRLVLVEGARGSGTTRLLIHSAHVALGVVTDARLMHAVCIEGREGEFAPLDRVLLDRFQITPASAEIAARARITTEVGEVLGATDASTTTALSHLLGRAAGVDFPDSPVLRGLDKNPDERRTRTVAAFARFLAADAARRPLWLGVDNGGRMDASAWEIIAALLASQAPLAIVVAIGDEDRSRIPALDPTRVVHVHLAPLGEASVGDLVRRLVPDLEDVPEALVAAITHRSSGLPSEVRQLVFSLYESELFVPAPGGKLRVDLARMERGELPISMDDALRSRLANLDAEERSALEMASICGESFWDGALLCQARSESTAAPPAIEAHDDESDAYALASSLARLVAKGFVQASAGTGVVPANEYRFSTPRMRALVYAGMADAVRRARHRAVARWLDVAAARRRDAVSATVGFHLELADERSAAGEAYARAASLERMHRRFDKSLGWLERAIACTPESDPMAHLDLAHDRGVVLVAMDRHDDGIASFARMYALARQLGARAKQAAALDRIARAYLARGQTQRAAPLLDRALTLSRQSGDRRSIASCLDDIAQAELTLGRPERAHMAATEALEIRRALGDARGESLSLTTLGRVALRRGELAMAEERLRTALTIRESLDDVEGVIVTLVALGRVCFERGDREASLDLFQRGLALARDLGDRRAEQTLLSHLAEANLVLGRLAAADSSITAAKELAFRHADGRAVARCDVLVGRIAIRKGDERANRVLRLALEAAEGARASDVVGLAHRALGQLHAMRVPADAAAARAAAEHFTASAEAFGQSGSEKERARTLLDHAMLDSQLGARDRARAHLAEASRILGATQLPEARVAERMLASLG